MSSAFLDWTALTTIEAQTLDPDMSLVVLPMAAIEQHGPHLPLGTDLLINEGILDAVAPVSGLDVDIYRLPALTIGKSDEHQSFAGTLSLSSATLANTVIEMADGLARSGVRKLLIFNSHGGNPEVIRICTRVLRQRFQILAVEASWGAFGLPDGLIAPEDAAHDLHAGFVETSMMLHLRPELVRRHAIAAVEPKTRDWEEDHDILMPEGIVSFGWQSEDIHPSGVIGNPSGASAEAGSAIIAHCADMVGKVLRDMARFRWT